VTQLKPINQQVVAVVGASSGIGRETVFNKHCEGGGSLPAAGLASLVDEIRRLAVTQPL